MTRQNTTVQQTPLLRNSTNYQAFVHEPLTPNHSLLLRSSPNQCPGVFEENSSYARKKWMYVQHLANVFLKRWIDEFLPMLNKRQKWLTKEENLKRDSIVLLVDERVPRAKWLLGRVVDV